MQTSRILMTRRIPSYPPYVGATQAPSPRIPPRDLLPVARPPRTSAPQRPARPAFPAPPGGFLRTQHAAPAAWPRSLRESSGDLSRSSHPFRNGSGPEKGEGKEARNARIVAEKDKCIDIRRTAHRWNVQDATRAEAPGMWINAERWQREKPSGGLTLVMTSACGLQSEHWHPTLQRLLSHDANAPGALFGSGDSLGTGTNVVIDDVWLIDDTHHGASIDLNAGRLGAAHSWNDTARDVINFVEHVRPAVETEAPWTLEWNDAAPAGKGKVVAIGHSYGGNALVQAAHARPELFEALLLVEPMCNPEMVNAPAKGYPLTLGALKRRSEWPSRAAAAEANRGNALFSRWDPDVFELWLDHSLVPIDPSNPDGPVTLATAPWAEAAVFSDPESTYWGWDQLASLTMPTGMIMSGDEFWLGGEKIAHEMSWRPPFARNERIPDASHLVVQEKPQELADAIWRFLTTLNAGEWKKDAKGKEKAAAKL